MSAAPRARRGEIYTVPANAFRLGFVDPEGALVLSSDEWNDRMGSATAALVYVDAPGHPRPSRSVDIGDGYYVDCGHLHAIDHDLLDPNDPWEPVTSEQMLAVGVQAHLHLSISDLVNGTLDDEYTPLPTREHVPRRGAARWVDYPTPYNGHSFVILSSRRANDRNNTATCLLLTSKTNKPGREKWEVAVPGGCVVVGDVFTFPLEDFSVDVKSGFSEALDTTVLTNIGHAISVGLP